MFDIQLVLFYIFKSFKLACLDWTTFKKITEIGFYVMVLHFIEFDISLNFFIFLCDGELTMLFTARYYGSHELFSLMSAL